MCRPGLEQRNRDTSIFSEVTFFSFLGFFYYRLNFEKGDLFLFQCSNPPFLGWPPRHSGTGTQRFPRLGDFSPNAVVSRKKEVRYPTTCSATILLWCADSFCFGDCPRTAFVFPVLRPHEVQVLPIIKLASNSYFLCVLGTIDLVGEPVGESDGEPFVYRQGVVAVVIVVHGTLGCWLLLRKSH